MRKVSLFFCMFLLAITTEAQKVDYSVVAVNEESGLNLKKVSSNSDYISMPKVKRHSQTASWWTGRVISIKPNYEKIAFLSFRGNSTNIYVKDIEGNGTSLQRTKRSNILNFSYSPDGKKIVFSEVNGKTNRIFITDADNGYICKQVTNDEKDFAPVYSSDMSLIFFSQLNKNGSSEIWCYSLSDHSLSFVTSGSDPYPIPNSKVLLCTRFSGNGLGEIWRINYETGEEECVVSDVNHSFTSPQLSPDGKWILMVGSSLLSSEGKNYVNTDIYVARSNGNDITQLTYHAADDVSPIWSNDGKYIYFVSQRGSDTGSANIWKMDFQLK